MGSPSASTQRRRPPGHLRLLTADDTARPVVTAPNGTVVEFAPANPPLALPPLDDRFVLTRMEGGDAAFHEGRAGMRYRDLIPGRLGGRFIASHILIPTGGPVATTCTTTMSASR